MPYRIIEEQAITKAALVYRIYEYAPITVKNAKSEVATIGNEWKLRLTCDSLDEAMADVEKLKALPTGTRIVYEDRITESIGAVL